MFDTHRLKFDIYYYELESPVIELLLNLAKKHNISIYKVKKTGTFVISYKIIINDCPKAKFLDFVEEFLHCVRDNINHPEFK